MSVLRCALRHWGAIALWLAAVVLAALLVLPSVVTMTIDTPYGPQRVSVDLLPEEARSAVLLGGLAASALLLLLAVGLAAVGALPCR